MQTYIDKQCCVSLCELQGTIGNEREIVGMKGNVIENERDQL